MIKSNRTMKIVLAVCTALLLAGCNNFWHDLVVVPVSAGPSELAGEVHISDVPGGAAVTASVTGATLYAVYGGEENVTYQWNENGTPIDGATAVTYTPMAAGSYSVTVSAVAYADKTSVAVDVKNCKVNYIGGTSELVDYNPSTSRIPFNGTGKTIESVEINGKPHLVGRHTSSGDLYMKVDADGNLQFRPVNGGFILIGSYAEFQLIRTAAAESKGKKFKQEANLDLMEKEWEPVCNNDDFFSGEFDGAGKTISKLKISGSVNYTGLFKRNSGTIRDVHIASGSTITVTGNYSYSGSIYGLNESDGTISGCSSAAEITGVNVVGGVAGYNNGFITTCYNTGSVSGNSIVGGVTGNSSSSMTGCSNTGEVNGTSYVGGVAGLSDSITACYWKTGTAPTGIGGGNGTAISFSNYFSPSGSDAWNTGTGETNGWWKAGTTSGGQLPKLWFE